VSTHVFKASCNVNLIRSLVCPDEFGYLNNYICLFFIFCFHY